MKTRQKKALLLLLAVLLLAPLLTQGASAMSSTNYAVEWFVPLSGGCGGYAASTNYAVNFTIGQAAVGSTSSSNYGLGVGYWYGILLDWLIHLPLVMR